MNPFLTRMLRFLLWDNLRITLVMALGAAAIYLLLPRPRTHKALYGAGLGVLALVLAGALLVGTRTAHPETFLFYAFSGAAIVGGGLLVTQRHPARAALAFALVVLSTCGLFLLLAAPFLMAATTIIYAGAILVTFLFVLMLAQQEGPSDADYRSREPLLATIAGFLMLGALLYLLQTTYDAAPIQRLLADTDATLAAMDAALAEGPRLNDERKNELIEHAAELLKAYQAQGQRQSTHAEYAGLLEAPKRIDNAYAVGDLREMRTVLQEVRDEADGLPRTVGILNPPKASLSEWSGPASSRPSDELRRGPSGWPAMPAENTAYLGRSLFTDYLLAVELGGTLLLVATIGAIAITYRRPSDARLAATRERSVE